MYTIFIFNVDKKGISQCHSPPHVVAGREVHPPAVTSGKSSTTTIIGCESAAGLRLHSHHILYFKEPACAKTFLMGLNQYFRRFIAREDHYVVLLLYGHATNKEMRVTASTISRYNIGSLASKAYTKALSPGSLQNAFKKGESIHLTPRQ